MYFFRTVLMNRPQIDNQHLSLNEMSKWLTDRGILNKILIQQNESKVAQLEIDVDYETAQKLLDLDFLDEESFHEITGDEDVGIVDFILIV